eukprot:PhF_6_TR10001/c0_g1_i1/m.15224
MPSKLILPPVEAFSYNNKILARIGSESVFDGMRAAPDPGRRTQTPKPKRSNFGDISFQDMARPGGFRQQYVKTRKRKVTTLDLRALADHLQVSVEALRAGLQSVKSQDRTASVNPASSPQPSFVTDASRRAAMVTTTMRSEPSNHPAPSPPTEFSPLMSLSTPIGGSGSIHVKISASVEERVESIEPGANNDIIVTSQPDANLAIFVQDDDSKTTCVALPESAKKKKKNRRVTFAEVESVTMIESNAGQPDNVMMMKIQLALPKIAWAFFLLAVLTFSFVPLMLKQLMNNDTEHVQEILAYTSWQTQGTLVLVCFVASAMAPYYSESREFLKTRQGVQHMTAAIVLVAITLWSFNIALMRTTSLMQASLGWGLNGPLILLWRWLSQDTVILKNEVIGGILTLAGTITLLFSEPAGIETQSDSLGLFCAIVSGITSPMFFMTLKSMRYRLPVHIMLMTLIGGIAIVDFVAVVVTNTDTITVNAYDILFGWRDDYHWWVALSVLTFLAYFSVTICTTFFDPFTIAIGLSGQMVIIRLAPLMTGLHDEHTDVVTVEQWASILIGGVLCVFGAGLGAHFSAKERSLVHVHVEPNANFLSATMGLMMSQQVSSSRDNSVFRGIN